MTTDDACFQAFHKLLVDHLYVEGASRIPLNKARKVFEDPRVKVFLGDLTKTVSKQNVLSRKEVSAYRELKRSGRLESDIALSQRVEKTKIANEDLEEEIARLDRSIAVASEEREQLAKELDHLDIMTSNAMEKQSIVNSCIVEMKHRLQENKCRTQETCQQMERTMSALSDGVTDLCSAVQNVDDRDNLFAHANLKEFLKAQDCYNVALTTFVKAYLNEITQAFMNDSGVASSLSGENGASINEDEKRKSSTALARAGQSPMLDASTLKAHELRVKIDELRRQEIPSLVSKLSDLFKSHMLIGSHNAKSEYQKYIMEKQKKVILLLHYQHAMLDVVSILLSGEKAGHEKTAKEIHSLCDALRALISNRNPEIEWLKQVQETSVSTKRTLFSGKDLIALETALCLSDTDYSSSFLGFNDLPLMAENHQKALKDLENSLVTSEQDVKELSNMLNDCWSGMSSGARSHSGIRLTQESLATWISNLEGRLHELSDILMKSCDEVDKKKRLLKHDSTTSIARLEWQEFVSKSADPS